MKTIFICLAIIISSGSAIAQSGGSLSKGEVKKLLREERKREIAEQKSTIAREVEEMMKINAFVLEADMLFDRYGQSMVVNSTLNFIVVDSLYGVIQVGDSFNIGRNGVGGVTVDGKVTNFEKKLNERKNSYHIDYTLQSSFGTYYVDMNVTSSGNADATIRGNFSGMLRFSGKLVHPSKTRVYQGTAF